MVQYFSKHLKATLRFLSKCLRTDTAFLIKKYKSFLQWPSTASVQGYQTLARMRKSKCAVDLVHELPSSMLSNCEHRSSDPESHPKVGFESVSGFGFRVSGFGFRRLKPTFAVGFGFRVSGFGFRRLKPTYSLSVSGFGFRVSSIETHFRCRFRVSGFGFRRLQNQLSLPVSGFGFRVSGFVDWNPLLLSVSGFGFRVSSPETNFRCRFRDSGFGFRVSSIEANFSCPFRVSGFGFRRSKPPLDSPVRCRSHITQVSFSMQSSKTRAVSDKRLKRSERKNGNGLGETCQHP